MRLPLSVVILACAACGSASTATPTPRAPSPAEAEVTEWDNAHWLIGRAFVDRSMFTAGGVFVDAPSGGASRKVDLHGAYVVPPFGDAHHHGIDSEDGLDAKIAAFLDAGIFYVKNPNVIPDLLTPAVRAKINTPASIDASFSNGGITSTGGHPGPLHDMLAKQGVFKGLGPGDMENRAYFVVDAPADLDAKWPRIVGGHPDFIKVFLLFGGGQPLPPDLPPMFAKGLDPKLLPDIVGRAHAAKLRVSAHVSSAIDFRDATDAGVDEINHLPFLPMPAFCKEQPSECLIDSATAKRAAAKDIVVVTTLAPPEPPKAPADFVRAIVTEQRANFDTLRSAGVRIALGSDGISGQTPFMTAQTEATYLADNHFADNATLLAMWTETTAQTIFPARKIGRIAPGYEASFLALAGDPIADFANVKRIAAMVKQGHTLHAPARAPTQSPVVGSGQ